MKRWWSRASCPWMSVDILGTNCDQCWSTVQYCFTSTETIRLVRMESPGWPPQLAHSSWPQKFENIDNWFLVPSQKFPQGYLFLWEELTYWLLFFVGSTRNDQNKDLRLQQFALHKTMNWSSMTAGLLHPDDSFVVWLGVVCACDMCAGDLFHHVGVMKRATTHFIILKSVRKQQSIYKWNPFNLKCSFWSLLNSVLVSFYLIESS